jgi:hypothetical protein
MRRDVKWDSPHTPAIIQYWHSSPTMMWPKDTQFSFLLCNNLFAQKLEVGTGKLFVFKIRYQHYGATELASFKHYLRLRYIFIPHPHYPGLRLLQFGCLFLLTVKLANPPTLTFLFIRALLKYFDFYKLDSLMRLVNLSELRKVIYAIPRRMMTTTSKKHLMQLYQMELRR